jgi:hypothetical protein
MLDAPFEVVVREQGGDGLGSLRHRIVSLAELVSAL